MRVALFVCPHTGRPSGLKLLTMMNMTSRQTSTSSCRSRNGGGKDGQVKESNVLVSEDLLLLVVSDLWWLLCSLSPALLLFPHHHQFFHFWGCSRLWRGKTNLLGASQISLTHSENDHTLNWPLSGCPAPIHNWPRPRLGRGGGVCRPGLAPRVTPGGQPFDRWSPHKSCSIGVV